MSIGGPIEEVNINGRSFSAAGDSDSSTALGGFNNEVQANGNGTARVIATRVPWSFEGITLSIDQDNGDMEYLQDFANSRAFGQITVTYSSGAIYGGSGQLTGEIKYGSQNTTAEVNIMGQGTFTKQ